MPASSPAASYCGPPPLLDDLWGRWNLDPVLLAAMALAVGIFMFGAQRSSRERASFVTAMAVLAVIFVSPLCALTVALFSARVVHHVLLVTMAAPLLAWALSGRRNAATDLALQRLLGPFLLVHTLIFWLWHAPAAYQLALTVTPIYWAMQATLLVSATLFWAAVLRASASRAIMALLAITVQMGLLGALLVFTGQPLYRPHSATTLSFGLEPLADQQLAGLIMWVPASLPYLLVAVLRLAGLLRQGEAHRA